MLVIRPGEPRDVAEIRAIQAASPQSAGWDPVSYLNYDLRVAAEGARVAGFLVGRTLAPREHELLDLAVAPEFRRQGIGKALLRDWLKRARGDVFLEVRPSNSTARLFYKLLGFQEVGSRPDYYRNPSEPAIVLKFHSC
ncbi:MAG TPA: ribosomal protein S18-alanine N-acetyltransferase [Bryobacteraceae bacterium]|nr:ribosomal protein S18-alanine N-acetyltransferase [Bryobacteraceae bacterium]